VYGVVVWSTEMGKKKGHLKETVIESYVEKAFYTLESSSISREG